MFFLYVNIDHLRLLKKSESFNEKEILGSIHSIISEHSGFSSDISAYLSIHPDGYNHSRLWVLKCINSLYAYLKGIDDLVGFSIILHRSNKRGDDLLEELKSFGLKVIKRDSVWGSVDALKKLNIPPREWQGISRISIPVDTSQYKQDHSSLYCQNLPSLNDDEGIDYQLCKYIKVWGKSKGFKQFLFFRNLGDLPSIIKFIKYLISKENYFNPLDDLNSDEVDEWGVYLDLYSSFYNDTYGAYVMDSPDYHLKKLVELWLIAFIKRYKTLLVIEGSDEGVVSGNLSGDNFLIIRGWAREKKVDGYEIGKMDDFLLRLLYLGTISSGFISVNELLGFLSDSVYGRIDLIDGLEYLKESGFFWGDNIIYSLNRDVADLIMEKYSDKVGLWHREFVSALSNKNNGYLINNLLSRIDSSDFQASYKYIEYSLQMGIPIDEAIELNDELKSYYLRKSARILDLSVCDIVSEKVDYLSVLNRWSSRDIKRIVHDSKELYISTQKNEDHLAEGRNKVIFSLSLLAVGRIDEAIDYLELNTGYCLSVNDRYSYIRSASFLMAAMFIKGNFTGVFRVYENLNSNRWVVLKSRWYIYALFIYARAKSELCEYEGAVKVIEEGIEISRKLGYVDVLRVLLNWKGLILFYNGDVKEGVNTILSLEPNHESFFFISIIEFFSDNHEVALEYIERIVDYSSDHILLDEKLLWRDGFSIIEDFYLINREQSIIKYEIDLFYSYVSSILRDECSQEIRVYVEGIPNTSLLEKDYKSLYYLYKLLDEKDVDNRALREKMINKAIRLLQNRTNSIDSHNRKVDFYNNFWNKKIMNERV